MSGNLAVPSVHLNGTSREALAEQYEQAAWALRKAIRALEDAAPNARDYYVRSPEYFEQAKREQTSRWERLQSVLTELADIHEAIVNGPEGAQP